MAQQPPTNRLTLAFDLDLNAAGTKEWLHSLARAMDSTPGLLEPVVSADVIDIQQVHNPARISFVDEMQKQQMQDTQEVRGPFIRTDPETGKEFVEYPELEGGKN